MVSKTVKVINPQGLHMRPAQLFVAEMGKYDSTVTIIFGEKTINAKSIMNLMASCIKMDSEIEISARAPRRPKLWTPPSSWWSPAWATCKRRSALWF